MSGHVRILGIAGSLRRGSYNQTPLRAAKTDKFLTKGSLR
jgi:NAD(P)H-dependent FMN reductase